MTRKQEQTIIIAVLGICLAAAAIGVFRSSGGSEDVPDNSKYEKEDKQTEVAITLPDASRGDTADARVTSLDGVTYNYRLFKQNAGYADYSDYLSAHGCSACALTTILRTTAEGLEDLTPDKAIEEVIRPTVGEEVFSRNFGKAMKRQMPITLNGMTLVLDKYGVEYKRPSADPDARVKEVTEWLGNGDPVLLTFGNGSEAHLSKHTHTVLLIGLDDDGKVIIGDSLHKSKSYWGNQGLIKSGKLTVSEMLSFIKKDDGWTINNEKVSNKRIFYKDSADRGYLLIRKNSSN